MKKGTKIFLFSATLLSIILLTIALPLGALKRENWVMAYENIRVANGMYREDKPVEQTVSEQINEINIDVFDKNIKVVKTENAEISLAYFISYENEFTFINENGVLSLNQSDSFNWFTEPFDFILQNEEQRTIIVNLPDKVYETVMFASNVGKIEVENIDVKNLTLKSSTGLVNVSNAITDSLNASCTTGSIRLNTVTSKTSLNCTTKTGAINITDTTSVLTNLKASTGSIKTAKSDLTTLSVSVSTGNIIIDETIFTIADLKTSTGSIAITTSPFAETECNFDVKTSTGSVKINGNKKSQNYVLNNEGSKCSIKAKLSTGSFIFTNV